MKNKIAIASAFVAASSFSMGEIVVNDFLSFEGFVDSSYSHTDSDVDGNENSFAVDQVEISWLFDFDAVTAQVDFDSEDSNGSNGDDVYDDRDTGSGLGEVEVEQAFVNYALANGDVATAGRYASMLGFEAFEPTGLYQYSTAYDASGLPGYAQGVKYTRESDASFFGISIQDEAFDNGQGNLSSSSYAIEAAYAQDLGNGLTVFLGGAYEDADAGDSYIVNAYATYETGAWLFAAEVNFGNSESGAFNDLTVTGADTDVMSGLVMANYAYNETASVTGRISYEEIEGNGKSDITKYTLAHNKALADNLALITEVSFGDADIVGADEEVTELAVELLFTF
ncbi:porin [Opitutales bacterium]|nr:porin [Opitutales bacterium]